VLAIFNDSAEAWQGRAMCPAPIYNDLQRARWWTRCSKVGSHEAAGRGQIFGSIHDQIGTAPNYRRDTDGAWESCEGDRAEKVRKRNYFAKYGEVARAVLQGLLDKYQDEGVIDLGDPNVLRIAPFAQIGTPVELVNVFSGKDKLVAAVKEVQAALYRETA
jgi:hypothetical protein